MRWEERRDGRREIGERERKKRDVIGHRRAKRGEK